MSLDKVKGYFKRREELLPFMQELLNEKVLRFLREEANITEVETLSEDKTEESETAEEATEK